MRRLILPKYKVSVDDSLIFLAGPIQGAGIWRNEAIKYLHNKTPFTYLASPDINVRGVHGNLELFGDESFDYQLNWERYYLDLAAKKGVVLFWLPAQEEAMPINPKTRFPQAYARDTRPETAGWGWKLLENCSNAKVIVGGEEDFDGFGVIKRNFLEVKPEMKFYSTLEKTCEEAVRLVKAA